jgi:hypothetical protein
MRIMGDTSMRWTRIVLSGSAVAALLATSACDPKPSSEAAAAPPTAAASSAAPVSSPAGTATKDAATTKACAYIKNDIKDNDRKVAKAKKIGPPAGHIAVSAQWTAGSAAVVAHSIGANEKVSAAADAVQTEMMALGDQYNKSANAKPSTAKLDVAVKNLNAACSAA